ncbi:MAG: RNase adapter RapZ [Nitrospirae bacterium]|nr:RNase adapter RapZ [Nitrospirota bacterium]
MSKLNIIIISGLSGSGKSYAIKSLEDMGYFCVDNLPTALVPKFVELCAQSDKGINRAALGIDIRERDFFGNFQKLHEEMKSAGYDLEVLFLEASDEVLSRRFSESRRPHPLAKDKPLPEAIRLERELMDEIRKKADRIIDTSNLSVHQLRDELSKHYRPTGGKGLTVSIMSFGFKYGVPYDADLVFDVRFLPNPHFVPELKPLTGMDAPVREFVLAKEDTVRFVEKINGLLDFLLPLYEKEGKNYLTIAFGCTGGRHRSVAVSGMLAEGMKARDIDVIVRHRDVEK